ncbi:MAG: phage holin family protein [Clostridium sp.]|uniref:phage holin family protein n=1 Tax=Clostridium sp. TaxID=1506 RepID=UPI003EE6654C
MTPTYFSEELLRKLHAIIQDNIYIYVALAVLCFVLGGIDELLLIFALLNIINLLFATYQAVFNCDWKILKNALKRVLHNFVIVVIGSIADRLLHLDSAKVMSLRNYLLLWMSHKELVLLYVTITIQGAEVPIVLKHFIKFSKRKSGGDDRDD